MFRCLIILFILLPCLLQAQGQNRYVVFFKDKKHNTFSLEYPEQFLSTRSIKRRASQQIPINLHDLPVSHQYIEKVKEKGAEVFYSSRWLNALLVEAEETLVQELEAMPQVESVLYVAPGERLQKSPDGDGQRISTRQEKSASVPLNVQNSFLGIPELQQEGFIGEGKMIAVLDGGFTAVDQLPYFDHLFTHGKLKGKFDFTTSTDHVFRYSGHGTKALSTISAIDSATFIGTAPGADILLAVTEDVGSEYLIEEFNWLFAAEWADSAGADVITASLGYSTYDDPEMSYTYAEMDGKSTVAARAAEMATQRGIVVVVSAGNSGNDPWKYIVTPADAAGVISVGAIQENREIASFSSRGPSADGRRKPEVVALGHRTIVAELSGGFTLGSGTSFAAPQIAGFAASLWQAFPSLDNQELRRLLLLAGDNATMPDTLVGWGVPSFARFKTEISKLEAFREEGGIKVYPNPVQHEEVFVEFSEDQGTEVFASLYSTLGQQLIKDQKLKQVRPGTGTYQLNLTGLKEGIFFLQIYSEKGKYLHKIIKQ